MALRRVLLLTSMTVALVALGPAGATGATNATQRPILGFANGTTTVNLTTGAGTTVNHGYLLGIGLFTGNSSPTFAFTGPSTFSGTGTGSLVTANGNEVFLTSSVSGTLSGTAVTARTVDTITGGTGRFVGAGGQFTITAKGTSASTVGSTETFTTLGIWKGTISYPVVSLADLAGSLTGTGTALSGCSFVGVTLNATYPGSSAVGTVSLQMSGCIPEMGPNYPFTFEYSGTFTFTTGVGTLSGSVAGQIDNTNLSPPPGINLVPATADLTLTATSGTGDFMGTTGTLNVGLQWPDLGSSTFTGTVTPA
jgi:hypothetical protein